jgi:hypothetical protein
MQHLKLAWTNSMALSWNEVVRVANYCLWLKKDGSTAQALLSLLIHDQTQGGSGPFHERIMYRRRLTELLRP